MIGNADKGDSDCGTINQRLVARVDDPACSRLANYAPQTQRPVAFGKVLGVRERVSVGDENGGQLKGALPQHDSCRSCGKATPRHRHVSASREYVDGIGIHEATIVVAYIDHDTLTR